MLRYSGAVALALLAASCSTVSYPDAPKTGPVATLVFSKGHESSWGVSGSQLYSISENHQCTDKKDATRLLWTTPHSESAKVSAARRIVVIGVTTYFSAEGYTQSMNTCAGSASFVTEAGHTYQVMQVAPQSGACRFQVTDDATGAAPPSLRTSDRSDCEDYAKLGDS